MNNIEDGQFINSSDNIPIQLTTLSTLARDTEIGIINGWSIDIEELIEKIRKNSIILSHHHKKYYNYLHP